METPNPTMLIQQNLPGLTRPEKSYPSPLPEALRAWYCYTIDGGHSILTAVKLLYSKEKPSEEFLVAIPVKTAMRGYEQQDGYIVVDVPYDPSLGVVAPAGDEEM